MKKIVILMVSALAVGCASLPEKEGLRMPKEEVISRIDGMSSRPSWLKESEPFLIKDNVVSTIGMATVPADSRIEAVYRVAANNGKAEISKAIEQRLSFVFQNAEEGTGFDANQVRYIGAEATELTANSFKLSHQYWEKVFAVDEHGQSKTFYRVYALITMPETDFKQAIIQAANKRLGKGISNDFKQKVDAHWDKFVAPTREAASEKS